MIFGQICIAFLEREMNNTVDIRYEMVYTDSIRNENKLRRFLMGAVVGCAVFFVVLVLVTAVYETFFMEK